MQDQQDPALSDLEDLEAPVQECGLQTRFSRGALIAPAPPSSHLAAAVSVPFILTSGQVPTVPGLSQVMATPGKSQMTLVNFPLPSAMPLLIQTQTSSQTVPYTTQQYRTRKLEGENAGTVKRKNEKKCDTLQKV